MNQRDLHTSLKSEVIEKGSTPCGEAVLVRQMWSKTDVKYSVHVGPNLYTSFGLQWPDFLSYLGFSHLKCSFLPSGQCYAREVPEGFDLKKFSEALRSGFTNLENAQKQLGSCGFVFDQPEGWGYFFGKQGGGRSDKSTYRGDGHSSGTTPEVMKASEDDAFNFLFTWIKLSEREKGWTIHYRPKHLPVSVDIESVFNFLGISQFNSCPNFDFDPCWWRHIEYKGNDRFDSNADQAHRAFDAHAQNFSKGIKSLLDSQAAMEEVGLGFLPIQKPADRRAQDISNKLKSAPPPKKPAVVKDVGNFDVAISFAGTERKLAEELATKIRDLGFSVFYDDFFPEQLWGKNLVEFFHSIYSSRARYCVIFVSGEYLNRAWTVHERQSAQERMLKEKGQEYILPIKVEEVDLPGIPSTIGYLPIGLGIEKISELLANKLKT